MKSSNSFVRVLALAMVTLGLVAARGWTSPQTAPQPGVSQVGPCPEWTLEIDLAPRPGPGRGLYRLVAAIRDAGGARLQTISVDVAPGQDARSERTVPGGGIFAVEVTVDGDRGGASWSAEVRRGEGVVLSQRARVQLGD